MAELKLKAVRREINRLQVILEKELPEIDQTADGHIVEVLLKTLDKIEAHLLRPGRYQDSSNIEGVAVDALYRDAFLLYGSMLRRWLTRPEEEKTALGERIEYLKSFVAVQAARLPFWTSRGRTEGED